MPFTDFKEARMQTCSIAQDSKISLKKVIKYLAVALLIVAYMAGFYLNQDELTELIKEQIPGKSIEKINSNPEVYKVSNLDTNKLDSWLLVTKQQGWGGPMHAGALITDDAKLKDVFVLSHKETPSFFKALVDNGYFKQYFGKPIEDAFQINRDIDAVSGATVTSRAIADAVRKGSHFWGRDHFDYKIDDQPVEWKVGANEFILLVFFAIIIFGSIKKHRRLRYVTLGFSIVFLGFYLSMPISVSSFASLLMGYVPTLSGHVFWWLLLIGVILMTLVLGKNVYCSWACPFGGFQEYISLIGGFKTKVNPRINRLASTIVFGLFWLSFMIMFITSNPGLGTFEPFGVLFSFKGLDIQWYLVSVAIIGSFIIPRFWCRFFCPVGLVLKKLARVKQGAIKLVNRKRMPANVNV